MKITFEPDGVWVEKTEKGYALKLFASYSDAEVWFKNPRPDVVRVELPFTVMELGLLAYMRQEKVRTEMKEVEK